MQTLHPLTIFTFKKCLAFLIFTIGLSANSYLASMDLTNEHRLNTEEFLPIVDCDNNILTNPDFENGNVSAWEGAGQYAETGSDRYISVCNNGTNARQTQQASAGETYNLSLMARKSSGANGVVRLKFLSGSYQPLLEEFIGINSTSFQNVSTSATAPSGTAFVEVSLIKDSGSGCVDADDWCLTDGGGGGGGNGPDLNLARLLNLPNNADLGAVVSFNFDIINSGDEAVSGNYSIGAYLSNDSNFGNGDVRVGEVNTGNTAIGTISNVQGAITVPANQATGSYFLILKADDGEVITESNESNNFLSGNIFINGDGGGGDGPTISLTTPSLNVNGPFQVTATYSENVTGFTLAEIQVNNGTKSNAQKISDAVYRWTVNPTISSGTVTVLVLANSAHNSAGEGNQESNLLSVTVGDGEDLADLEITNVNLSQYTANPGDDIGVFIDAASLGAPFDLDLSGGYFLAYFLSADGDLSGNDPNIGGSLQRTLGSQIGVGVTIPENTPPGQYVVIVEADIRDGSPESNLENNIAVTERRITIVEPGADDCGFLNTYDVPRSSFTPYTSSGGSSGFSFAAISGSIFSPALERSVAIIDRDGSLSSYTTEEVPTGYPSQLGNYVLQVEGVDETTYDLLTLGFGGAILDRRTFNLSPSNSNYGGSIGSFNIIELEDRSVIAVSVYTDRTNGRQFPFVIKIDRFGNEAFETELPEVQNFTSINPLAIGQNNDVYVRYNLPGRVGQINKVSFIDGSLLWEGPRVGDLVSNRINTPVESVDGSALYVPIYNDPFATIGKYDAATGAEIFRDNAGALLGSDSDGFFGRNVQLLPTSDGGVVVGYNFDSPVSGEEGYEYGKLDANGNVVYTDKLPFLYNLTPVFEVENGGIIFTGVREGQLAIARITAAGALEPDCDTGGGGDGIDLELGSVASNLNPPQWSFFSVTFTLTNNGTENESGIEVEVPLSATTGLVFKGGDEFEASQGSFSPYGNNVWNVGSLSAGSTATLTVNYFISINSLSSIFAQVIAQDGQDIDSSPNNNTSNSASEDDETGLTLNRSAAAARAAFGESQNEYDLKNQIRNFKILKTYPSLTANDTRVVLNSKMETEMTIKIYNSSGVEVTQQNVHVIEGVNDIQIKASNFQSGMYNVMLFPEEGSTRPLMTRFVKQGL